MFTMKYVDKLVNVTQYQAQVCSVEVGLMQPTIGF